eukprot:scaffold27476_cov28-Tisochrysis_lutea.AAC.2
MEVLGAPGSYVVGEEADVRVLLHHKQGVVLGPAGQAKDRTRATMHFVRANAHEVKVRHRAEAIAHIGAAQVVLGPAGTGKGQDQSYCTCWGGESTGPGRHASLGGQKHASRCTSPGIKLICEQL